MSQAESFTFYTYSRVTHGEDRWAYTGLPDFFFHDEEGAREALRELRDFVISDPDDTWTPMILERIETLPVSKESILALLNDGVGAFVKNYEIVEVVG